MLSAPFLATFLGDTVYLVGKIPSCELKWTLMNKPYKLQLQILKFGVKFKCLGAGVMAQWLRALIAHTKDLSSIPSIHMTAL